jgi:hypothetical protein
MGQAGQAGATLGQLGSAQLGAAQGIINAQNQMGQQQQAQEQQKINQAIQNYATQQQYPLMELGTMSNMLRGLPMQASTTQQYQAAPSALTQGIGIAGALGSLGQSGIFGSSKKEGGVVSSYADGGIASYDIGGAVKADLERMPTEKLKQLESSAKGIELSQIKQILNDREQGAMPEFAPGGIVAFAEGTPKDYPDYSAPAEEGTSALERYLDRVKNNKMGKARVLGEDMSDFAKRAAERNAITKQIDDLTPGIFSPRKIYDKETSAQQADYDAKIAELKAKRAAIPFFVNNQSGGGFDPNAKPAATMQDKPAAEAAPKAEVKEGDITSGKAAETAPKTIVDPSKSILNAVKGSQDPNKLANIMNAQDPMFSLENLNKYGDQKAEERKKAYLEQVKNAPMSPEGQKLYDSYEDKVKNAKTKEEQKFWMHSALFFARLGSTPGSVGFAALTALKDELPAYIKDKDALEEYQDKIQKSMYELSNAEMLKRQGQFDAGEKARHEAITDLSNFYIHKSTIEYHKNMGEAAKESAKNKGVNAGLGEEKLDVTITKDINKDITDATKDIDKALSIARLGNSPEAKARVATLEAQRKDIENKIYKAYKRPPPNPEAASKGTNIKDPLNLGI